MIAAHPLNNSRSQRVLWLLQELDVPTGSGATSAVLLALPQLRAIHQSPVITDGELTVAESGANGLANTG